MSELENRSGMTFANACHGLASNESPTASGSGALPVSQAAATRTPCLPHHTIGAHSNSACVPARFAAQREQV